MGPVRPASIFVGTAAFVVLSPPGVECFLAKRRHHPAPTGYTDVGDTPSLLEPQQGLIREESSIPGVSIWAPKTATATAAAGSHSISRNPTAASSSGDDLRRSRLRASRCIRGSDAATGFPGVDQDDAGDVGDADVEPPSRGAREAEESLSEAEFEGVLTTEDEEDEHANEDAAPGRLLEEGGGSDSQEDDDDGDDEEASSESEEERSEDEEQGEDDDDFASFSGGSSSDPLTENEDDETEMGLRSASSSRGFGHRGGGSSSGGEGGGRSWKGGKGRRGDTSPAIASKYDDEEECFQRVKELWYDRVLLPLSQDEVLELSEGVRAEQKKLMAAAPTEWNSRPGFVGKKASRLKEAKDKAAAAEAEAEAGGRKGDGRHEGGDGAGEEDGTAAVVSETAAAEEAGGRGARGGGGAAVDDDSSLGLLYRLLLAEMHQGNGPSGGLNNRWIDPDALLQLRGAATLAHHPEYLRHTANLPRVTRGVRLVAPEATHSMQEALARSLGHSTGSKLVLLDAKAIDSVRERALADGVPKDQLTSRKLASALLELAEEDGSPFVLFLKDKGSAVLGSRGMCQRLTEELKNESSRVLFLLSTASDPSVPGNSPNGSGDDANVEDEPRQGSRIFGSALQWNPPPNTPPGQYKLPDGAPKKNYFFLQQTPPPGDNSGGGAPGGYFGGGSRSNRSGGGRSGGGRPGGRGRGQQGFGGGGGNGRGMPPGDGPPIPPQMLEQMLREAMKNMQAGAGNRDKNGGEGDGTGNSHSTGTGTGNGGGDIPPGLMEALGEALNDEDFKKTLEQIGKQLGEDPGQGFSIMFSTGVTTPNGDANDNSKTQEGDESASGSGGGGEASHPWGAGGSNGNTAGDGKGGSWQSSSSLSWLTNLRKGIMSGDEGREDGSSNEHQADMAHAGGRPVGGAGGGGDGRGKAHTRRGGLDSSPSGSEMRAFANLFEDIAVDPPRDAVLRQHWDTWVKEDVGKHNTQQNRQVLLTALRRSMLACPDLKRLDPLLARHRLTQAETGQVVLAALKIELSQVAAAAASAAPDGKDASSSSSSPSSSPQPPPSPRRTAKGRLVISRQSMETAFASVCKAHVPRPGQPMSRTREEVTALAQNDRHEQALVSNVILPKDIGVTYDMIGGLGGAKELLRQCITYPLRFPHLYNEGIAREAVKGVLLFGPPGTGKTMLAKAVATEGGATFLSVDASVIENKWLGESEKNARAVFTLARRLAPCVIFIDEVDSVLSSREKYDDTTHGTLTSVKTTLMQEWDGLRTGGDRVVVIASTNRPFDLDEAVLRRLPRRILVDLPDAETREEILKVSMAQNRVDASVNFTAITAELEGFTGSDIKEVCREAVVRIAHEKAQELDKAGVAGIREDIDLTAQLRPVTMEDFWEARKKLTASVSEKGRELSRVWEWNEEYGEVKKKRSDASAHHLSMYL